MQQYLGSGSRFRGPEKIIPDHWGQKRTGSRIRIRNTTSMQMTINSIYCPHRITALLIEPMPQTQQDFLTDQ
jgi:hypothetical protein